MQTVIQVKDILVKEYSIWSYEITDKGKQIKSDPLLLKIWLFTVRKMPIQYTIKFYCILERKAAERSIGDNIHRFLESKKNY